MLIFTGYRPAGYPPSDHFPAFCKDRKVNVEGSIGQEGRQAMMDRRSGSTALLAARAPESAQVAMRGESVRPGVTQPSALNQPLAVQPPQPPPRTQHFQLDAGDDEEGQMVPYGGGGPPPPDPGGGFSLVAPVRDFVSRQYTPH